MWALAWQAIKKIAKKAFSNVWIWAAIGTFAILSGVFGAGYWSASQACAEGKQRGRADALEIERNQLRDDLADIKRREAEIEGKANDVRIVTHEIIKEIPVHVADNDACGVGDDVIGLFNSAGGEGVLPPSTETYEGGDSFTPH